MDGRAKPGHDKLGLNRYADFKAARNRPEGEWHALVSGCIGVAYFGRASLGAGPGHAAAA